MALAGYWEYGLVWGRDPQVGALVGLHEACSVGEYVGLEVGDRLGAKVGDRVTGARVGKRVGEGVVAGIVEIWMGGLLSMCVGALV